MKMCSRLTAAKRIGSVLLACTIAAIMPGRYLANTYQGYDSIMQSEDEKLILFPGDCVSGLDLPVYLNGSENPEGLGENNSWTNRPADSFSNRVYAIAPVYNDETGELSSYTIETLGYVLTVIDGTSDLSGSSDLLPGKRTYIPQDQSQEPSIRRDVAWYMPGETVALTPYESNDPGKVFGGYVVESANVTIQEDPETGMGYMVMPDQEVSISIRYIDPQPEAVPEEVIPEEQIPEAQPEEVVVPEAQPEEVVIPEAQPEEVVVPEAQPEEVVVPEAQPEEVIVPEAQPEEVVVPEAQPEEVAIPEAQPEEVVVPEAQPEEVVVPEAQPDQPVVVEDVSDELAAFLNGTAGNADEQAAPADTPAPAEVPEVSDSSDIQPQTTDEGVDTAGEQNDAQDSIFSNMDEDMFDIVLSDTYSDQDGQMPVSDESAGGEEDKEQSVPEEQEQNEPAKQEDQPLPVEEEAAQASGQAEQQPQQQAEEIVEEIPIGPFAQAEEQPEEIQEQPQQQEEEIQEQPQEQPEEVREQPQEQEEVVQEQPQEQPKEEPEEAQEQPQQQAEEIVEEVKEAPSVQAEDAQEQQPAPAEAEQQPEEVQQQPEETIEQPAGGKQPAEEEEQPEEDPAEEEEADLIEEQPKAMDEPEEEEIRHTLTVSPASKVTVKDADGNAVDTDLPQNVAEGEVLQITADTSDAAYLFNGWTCTGASTASADLPSTTITVGEEDITLSASYLKVSTVTVSGGTGGGTYTEGDRVTISADEADPGWEFDRWLVTGGEASLADPYSKKTSFTMPSSNVTVTADYEMIEYTLTVNGGSGSGEYSMDEEVSVSASRPAEGKEFNSWVIKSGDPDITGVDRVNATITMPARDVTITATYKDGPLASNNAILNIVQNAEYLKGTTITFTASGAGMDNANPNPWDYRYRPTGYQIGTVNGGWTDTYYTTSMAINAVGDYTLQVTFTREVYNGSNWVSDGTTDTKAVSFHVVNALSVATGDNSPIIPLILTASAALLLIIALLFMMLRKKGRSK